MKWVVVIAAVERRGVGAAMRCEEGEGAEGSPCPLFKGCVAE